MKYIDLTHTLTNHMPVYPGDPEPELKQTAFLEKEGYNEFHLKAGMHTGTHIDAPFHMLPSGKKLSEYPPKHFFGKGHLLDAKPMRHLCRSLHKFLSFHFIKPVIDSLEF